MQVCDKGFAAVVDNKEAPSLFASLWITAPQKFSEFSYGTTLRFKIP